MYKRYINSIISIIIIIIIIIISIFLIELEIENVASWGKGTV